MKTGQNNRKTLYYVSDPENEVLTVSDNVRRKEGLSRRGVAIVEKTIYNTKKRSKNQ